MLSIILALCVAGASAKTVVVSPRVSKTTRMKDSLGGVDLDFKIHNGATDDIFFRKDTTAVNVSTEGGDHAHIVFAFPAGNSGTSAWFRPVKKEAGFRLSRARLIKEPGNLNGVRVQLAAPVTNLQLETFILGSIRNIRDYEDGKPKPEMLSESVVRQGNGLRIFRRSLDGKYEFQMNLSAAKGVTLDKTPDGHWEFTSERAPLRLNISSLTNEPPLTPIPIRDLVKRKVLMSANPLQLKLFAFLSYREKFLAGSWRYLTYFGRDTLLSLRMLMPALRPSAVEDGLGSVIERMNKRGEVAHEESIGDYAAYLRKLKGEKPTQKPIYDYKMIDADFLLAPVLDAYLDSVSPARAHRFLDRKTGDGITYREALNRNLRLVLARARAFGEHPRATNLVHIKKGQMVGDWRDSLEGLGFGRIPFDVNVALVPGALSAAQRLYTSPEFGMRNSALAKEAGRDAKVWAKDAANFFEVRVPAKSATRLAEKYMHGLGLRLLSLANRSIDFSALSLKQNGAPVKVMNSDEGFVLLFGNPSDSYLKQAVNCVNLPFPFGLMSPVGMFVANPAFAPHRIQKLFSRDHYHGTVVWSWQQALFAAGLARQLARTDLSKNTRILLGRAQRQIWKAIRKSRRYSNIELWTWRLKHGQMSYISYGEEQGHVTASNSDQLWSLVYLGIQKPQPEPMPGVGGMAADLRPSAE